MNRIVIGLISGALLGIVCIVGATLRDVSSDGVFLFAFWFNRVLMGLVIGLLPKDKLKPLLLKGAALGLLVSFAFYSATDFLDLVGFLAGIAYGIIIAVAIYYFVDVLGVMNKNKSSGGSMNSKKLFGIKVFSVVLSLTVATLFVYFVMNQSTPNANNEVEEDTPFYLPQASHLSDHEILIEKDNHVVYYDYVAGTDIFHVAFYHNDEIFLLDTQSMQNIAFDKDLCISDFATSGDYSMGKHIGYSIACYQEIDGEQLRRFTISFDAHGISKSSPITSLLGNYRYYEDDISIYRDLMIKE